MKECRIAVLSFRDGQCLGRGGLFVYPAIRWKKTTIVTSK